MSENDFSENNKARNTSNDWSFSHYFENNFSILGHGKHQKKISEKVMESHKISYDQKSTNPVLGSRLSPSLKVTA